MRLEDIKFKAKKLSDGSWVEGDLVTLGNGKVCIHYSNKLTDNAGIDVYHEVDPSTVCQYTGRKDSNGVEIYEHDILIMLDSDVEREVIWKPRNCSFVFKGTEGKYVYIHMDICSILTHQVIGNKFDKEKSK